MLRQTLGDEAKKKMDGEDKQSVETPITNEAFLEALREFSENLKKRAAKEPSEALPNSSSIYCDGLAELFADVSKKIEKLSESLMELKVALDKVHTLIKK